MAAGKGPFEERKEQRQERSLRKVGEELSERTSLQESTNPNMEAECTKAEALPTQETMTAGKGPFAETSRVGNRDKGNKSPRTELFFLFALM